MLLGTLSCEEGGKHEFDPPEGYKARSGKLIYTKHCASCHGQDGKLGVGGAKDLTHSTMDSTGMVTILKNGKNGMPRQIQYFKSDEEVVNVLDYIKSMRK
jgi:cytochrome c6